MVMEQGIYQSFSIIKEVNNVFRNTTDVVIALTKLKDIDDCFDKTILNSVTRRASINQGCGY